MNEESIGLCGGCSIWQEIKPKDFVTTGNNRMWTLTAPLNGVHALDPVFQEAKVVHQGAFKQGAFTKARSPRRVHQGAFTKALSPRHGHQGAFTKAHLSKARLPRRVYQGAFTKALSPRRVHQSTFTKARSPGRVDQGAFTKACSPR